jgi:hypothetical protein
MLNSKKARAACVTVGLATAVASACPMHAGMTAAQVTEIDAANALQRHPSSDAAPAGSAAIGTWKLNYNGATGHSANATINSLISSTQTDVQQVWFDANYIYVKHTGVPSYDVGRADNNNPAYAKNLNRMSRIPRAPVVATNNTALGNGGVGVMVNGALLFDAGDAMSYNNAGVWKRVALTFEGATFDSGPGHSAPQMGGTPSSSTPGTYHYHVGPSALLAQIDSGNTGQHHSPVIGYAFDGFPIYGPYGYGDPTNATGGIKRLASSYKVRDDLSTLGAVRDSTTEDGTTLVTAQWGPAVSTQYPAGSFKEDFEYNAGLGDLNDFNMRFAVTPEYPEGTWAYYMTTDAGGGFAYPYLLGPKYYGIVDTANLGPTGGTTTIPTLATRLTAGDANIDAAIDFADLVVLAQNYGHQGAALWTDGDFDSNTEVGFSDLVLLAQNYNSSSFTADWALAQSLVPEPALLSIAMSATLIVGRRSKRARRDSNARPSV